MVDATRILGAGVSINTADASAGSTMPTATSVYIEVLNNSTSIAHFVHGEGTQTATTAHYAILPATKAVIRRNPNATHFAAILATGSATGKLAVQPVDYV